MIKFVIGYLILLAMVSLFFYPILKVGADYDEEINDNNKEC